MELQNRMVMVTGLVTLAADRQGRRHCDGWPTPSTSAEIAALVSDQNGMTNFMSNG
jgi:hypothetical protein